MSRIPSSVKKFPMDSGLLLLMFFFSISISEWIYKCTLFSSNVEYTTVECCNKKKKNFERFRIKLELKFYFKCLTTAVQRFLENVCHKNKRFLSLIMSQHYSFDELNDKRLPLLQSLLLVT